MRASTFLMPRRKPIRTLDASVVSAAGRARPSFGLRRLTIRPRDLRGFSNVTMICGVTKLMRAKLGIRPVTGKKRSALTQVPGPCHEVIRSFPNFLGIPPSVQDRESQLPKSGLLAHVLALVLDDLATRLQSTDAGPLFNFSQSNATTRLRGNEASYCNWPASPSARRNLLLFSSGFRIPGICTRLRYCPKQVCRP